MVTTEAYANIKGSIYLASKDESCLTGGKHFKLFDQGLTFTEWNERMHGLFDMAVEVNHGEYYFLELRKGRARDFCGIFVPEGRPLTKVLASLESFYRHE